MERLLVGGINEWRSSGDRLEKALTPSKPVAVGIGAASVDSVYSVRKLTVSR
jgi:hypothetical protein